MGPEWKLLVDFGVLLASAIPKLIELFQHGGRDGVLVALDGALVVARAKTDADLLAKHAKRATDETQPVPTVPTLKR